MEGSQQGGCQATDEASFDLRGLEGGASFWEVLLDSPTAQGVKSPARQYAAVHRTSGQQYAVLRHFFSFEIDRFPYSIGRDK